MSETAERPVLAGAEIHEHRLRNGLRVLLLERHLDPVVAVTVWYRVGSRDEQEHEAGVSHFLEHMMFKGSERYGKGMVDLITTTLGGSNNAHTTYDHTAYWFELASDRWETALEIEADRMRGLLLEPAEFEAEKAVVLEELAMGLDDPWQSLAQQVSELLFPRHPYRRPIIGHADVLRAMTPELMRDYHRRYYHPGNATVVICGDVRPKAALRAVRQHLGELPAGPEPDRLHAYRPPIEPLRGERRLTTRWDDGSARLMMAWQGAVVGSDEDFVLDLVTALLTMGRLSRLHRRLVLEEGLAVHVGASNEARAEGGSFSIYTEAVQGVDPARLEAAVDEELERLAREPVGAAELKRARAILAATEAYEGETVTDLAEHVGGYAVDADWRLTLELGQRRAKVKARDVQRVARELLARERRVVAWSLPQEDRS